VEFLALYGILPLRIIPVFYFRFSVETCASNCAEHYKRIACSGIASRKSKGFEKILQAPDFVLREAGNIIGLAPKAVFSPNSCQPFNLFSSLRLSNRTGIYLNP